MSKFWVITKEVYKKNVKSFGFIIMVLIPLIIIGFIAGMGYFFSREAQDAEAVPVAILTEDQAVEQMFMSEEWNFDIAEDITTEEEAETALGEESIDGYMIVDTDGDSVQVEIVHANELSNLVPIITETLTNYQTMLRANELELSQAEVMSLTEPVEVEERVVTITDGDLADDDTGDRMIQEWSAYAVSIAIMAFIMTYSGIIAEEVANEKGTRIMEVILSSASATNHFFGKLVGVTLVMLTQIGIYAAVGTGAYLYFRNTEFVQTIIGEVDIFGMLQDLMGYTLIFFIAGVLMYVILAAFFGSLATKMEDVNKAVTPIVFVALAGFYVGLFAFASPENTLAVVFSYIPLFTPFVMPFRIASGTVATSGIWLSIIGTVGFAVLIAFVSLAFYRSNVLVYSDTNMIGTMKRSWSIMQSNRKAKKNNTA